MHNGFKVFCGVSRVLDMLMICTRFALWTIRYICPEKNLGIAGMAWDLNPLKSQYGTNSLIWLVVL